MILYSRFSNLPSEIKIFAYNGWIVGGAARYIIGLSDEEPRDWDILIPFENWSGHISNIIPKMSESNTFGGFKIKYPNVELDIWPDDLSKFAQRSDMDTYAVCIKTRAVIHIQKKGFQF